MKESLTIDSIVTTLKNCDIPVNETTLTRAISAYLSTNNHKDFIKELPKRISVTKLDIKQTVGDKLNLLQYIDDNHIIKRMAINASSFIDIPVNTVFLMGLGVFSSIACRHYKVNYEYDGDVPLGLFIISEHPSGTGKSRCLKHWQKPFFALETKARLEKNRELARLLKLESEKTITEAELEELDELKQASPIMFTTNATAEGLERILPINNGFFSAISSEKGLFNSLFGKTYSNGVSNNDLILNSFDSGYISVSRITRDGFSGNVAGSVVCFAQDGSIDLVVNDSNGSGLSERFLMITEPHRLGYRDHEKKHFIDFALIEEYEKICNYYSDVFVTQSRYEDLSALSISSNGFSLIHKLQNELEPHLANGKKLSSDTLRGAVAKIDIQVMKIAGILHLLDNGTHKPTIDDKHIVSAINMARDLLYVQVDLLKEKGIIGVKAEYTAILDYLAKQKQATAREIKQAKRNTQPFKSFTGDVSALIDDTIQALLDDGLIIQSFTGNNKVLYSIA